VPTRRKALRARRGGALGKRIIWIDHRQEADGDVGIGQRKQSDGTDERAGLERWTGAVCDVRDSNTPLCG
jgi:hypothetical protein